MAEVKNPEWNKNQLIIAKLLSEGKTAPDIRKLTGFAKTQVYAIKNYLDKGGELPPLDEAAINAAPPPSSFAKAPPPPPPGSEVTPATPKGDKIPSGLVRFSGVRIDCEYTPIMYIARQAATEKWNWNSDIRFEDFIDTILYWFFKDRGITLQGYIVDEEVEAG